MTPAATWRSNAGHGASMTSPAYGPLPPMAGRLSMKGREMEHDEWIDAAMHEPTPDDAAPYAWGGVIAAAALMASGAVTLWVLQATAGWLL